MILRTLPKAAIPNYEYFCLLSCCFEFTSEDHVTEMSVSMSRPLTDYDALYFCYPTRRALDSTRVVPRVELSRA